MSSATGPLDSTALRAFAPETEGAQSGKARWRQAIVTLLTAAAATLTAGVLAAVVGQPLIVAGVFAGAVLVAAVAMRTFVSHGTSRPRAGELALATVDALAAPATCCLGLVFVYYATYYVGRACDWLLSFVGVHWPWHTIALITFALVAVSYAIVSVIITTESMREKLYPDVAGVPSEYNELARRRRRAAVTGLFGLALPAAGVGLLLADAAPSWLGYLLLFYLLTVSTTASPPRPVEDGSEGAIAALAALFRADGYDVTLKPRTGKPEVDPLLVEVDLLADNGDHRFAVQVRERESASSDGTAESLSWTAATSLTTGARVMGEDLRDSQRSHERAEDSASSPPRVEPVLVLIDLEPDPSLEAYSDTESLAIVTVRTDESSAHVSGVDASPDLLTIARQYAALVRHSSSAPESPTEVVSR